MLVSSWSSRQRRAWPSNCRLRVNSGPFWTFRRSSGVGGKAVVAGPLSQFASTPSQATSAFRGKTDDLVGAQFGLLIAITGSSQITPHTNSDQPRPARRARVQSVVELPATPSRRDDVKPEIEGIEQSDEFKHPTLITVNGCCLRPNGFGEGCLPEIDIVEHFTV